MKEDKSKPSNESERLGEGTPVEPSTKLPAYPVGQPVDETRIDEPAVRNGVQEPSPEKNRDQKNTSEKDQKS